MSGVLDKLDPAVATLVVDAGKALAEWLVHKLTGDKDGPSAKESIAAIKEKAIDAAVTAALAQLKNVAAALELRLAFADLALAAAQIRAAIAEAETSPTVPRLDGLDMEMVPPGTLPDEQP